MKRKFKLMSIALALGIAVVPTGAFASSPINAVKAADYASRINAIAPLTQSTTTHTTINTTHTTHTTNTTTCGCFVS